jgi:hypothetical protein
MVHAASTAARHTVPAAGADDSSWLSTPHLIGFLLLWAVTQLGAALVWYPDVLGGGQVDTDGYMRLVRVRELLAGGAWFDPVIARSNAPFGEVMHWTRPLDFLIAVIALLLRPFMSGAAALAVSGAVISALCHAAVCVAAVWVVHPIVRGPERFLAMPAVLAQTSVMAYGGLGRADHHMLIFLLFTLALGSWIRALLQPADRRSAIMAGVWSGIGIWVGPETLLPLAVLLLSGAVAWIACGDRYGRANLSLCIGLAAAIALALVIERPPRGWMSVEFDRISVAHLHVALLALAFWSVARSARLDHTRSGDARARRIAIALVGATVAAAILLLLHPQFFRGPWVDVDSAVIGVWLARVTELQPAWPRTRGDVGRFISMLGAAIAFVPIVAVWLRREQRADMRLVWLLLLVSLLIYVPLAAAQQRFSPYAGIIATIASIELLRRGSVLLARFSGIALSVTRVTLIIGVLLWPVIAGETVSAAVGRPAVAATTDGGETCDLTDAARRLTRAFGEPQTIAAFIDFGPEILYRTPHLVLAGPYHRNRDGILAAHALLASPDDAAALEIVHDRGVDLILLCPSRDAGYFGGTESGSLYARMLRGESPPWMEEVPFTAAGFRLFAVQAGR